jgi:AcrR family transcriptional regulator
MPIPRARTVRSPETRRLEILEAAVTVFRKKGFSGATIADIAEEAEVAKGTFYLYFDSKDHLLGALRERLVDETIARAEAFYERVGKDDWWSLIDTMVESMIDFMLDQRDIMLIFAEEGKNPETMQVFAEASRRMNEMFAAGLSAGIAAGVFDVEDPYATAVFLHHAVEGALMEAVLYDPQLDRERLVGTAKTLIRRAVSPEK